MGGFASATDGAVEVDGSGTQEELVAELATEHVVTDKAGRKSAAPTVVEGDGDGSDEGGEAGKGGAQAGGEAGAAGEAGKAGGKKKQKSIQARIDEVYGEAKRAERERDRLAAENADLRRRIDGDKGGAADKGGQAFGDGKDRAAAAAGAGEKVGGVDLGAAKFPKYNEWLQAGNDGELEDYLDARDGWRDAKAEHVANAGAVKREHEATFSKVAKTFNDRMAPVLEEEPEFYEQVDPRLITTPALSALPPGTPGTFGNFLVEQVVRSEHPKEMMIHLSDKKVIQRLVTLQPAEILREITKYELSLGAAGANHSGPAARAQDDDDDDDDGDEAPRGRAGSARTEATSRAHPPAKPVRGSSQQQASPDEEPGDDASDDEWFRWAKKRRAQ